MELSIVASLYYSAPYVEEFVRRAAAAAAALTERYEIVLVNDGSPDDALAIALRLQAAEPHLRIVDLSRNYGHHQAMFAGLTQARGARIFLIDCDLEENPEVLAEFWRMLDGDAGLDVVYGVQNRRKGSWWEQASGAAYYALLDRLAEIHYPKNTLTARLMSRRYVDSLLAYGEKTMDLWGLFSLVGFRQQPVLVDKGSKPTTTYTTRKKLVMAVNIVTTVSSKPLVIISLVGLAITLLAFAFGAFIALRQMIYNDSLEGWTSLLVSLWLIGGMVIFCIGVIGIYLSKVFLEVKNRPLYVIRQIYERPAP